MEASAAVDQTAVEETAELVVRLADRAFQDDVVAAPAAGLGEAAGCEAALKEDLWAACLAAAAVAMLRREAAGAVCSCLTAGNSSPLRRARVCQALWMIPTVAAATLA